MTLDARTKVWNATFAVFKKAAKDHLAEVVRVDPEVFEGSRYGSPINQPTPIGSTNEAAKDLASFVQRSAGSPLDRAFAIDDQKMATSNIFPNLTGAQTDFTISFEYLDTADGLPGFGGYC